jgi:hypothetical protein
MILLAQGLWGSTFARDTHQSSTRKQKDFLYLVH